MMGPHTREWMTGQNKTCFILNKRKSHQRFFLFPLDVNVVDRHVGVWNDQINEMSSENEYLSRRITEIGTRNGMSSPSTLIFAKGLEFRKYRKLEKNPFLSIFLPSFNSSAKQHENMKIKTKFEAFGVPGHSPNFI